MGSIGLQKKVGAIGLQKKGARVSPYTTHLDLNKCYFYGHKISVYSILNDAMIHGNTSLEK